MKRGDVELRPAEGCLRHMAERILMLALSPTMETGTVAAWVKHEGDSVSPGDVLCEVETDKATMELESVVAGTLLKVVAGEGVDTEVGDLIAVVGEPGEDVSALLAEGRNAEESAAEAEAGPGEENDVPVATPTDRVGNEVADTVQADVVRASPLARKLAHEAGLDLASVRGTGPRGRVIKRDIEKTMASRPKPALVPDRAAPPPGVPARVSKKRRIAAERLSQSKFTAPHYYLKTGVQMDELLATRMAANESRAREERVSLNAFLLKLVALALERHPRVNSSWGEDAVIMFGQADIGLAVAVDDGLLVPVVRDCGSKGILAIDSELRDLIRKARGGELQPEEYAGATFTVSNLGSFGIEEFTAIINPPGSAILAVGSIRRELVVGEGDQTAIRSVMTLTLSCDHRNIDGAVGAAFLRELRAMIEHPALVLL